MRAPNRYDQIIERIFLMRYQPGLRELEFGREELETAAQELGVKLPKNLGDVVYSYRYRKDRPSAVRATAGPGEGWLIRAAGRSRYRFMLEAERQIKPTLAMAETKVPDATPGLVAKYALGDEQALLAKLRHNRLIDVFTGVTCYSLQSHLRTFVADLGQIETDELYIGVDRRGAHYAFPVQAKGGTDRPSIIQIEQDFAFCARKFPDLICRPIAAQFMGPNLIALFLFEPGENGLVISAERHYRLVPPEAVTGADLETYRTRLP